MELTAAQQLAARLPAADDGDAYAVSEVARLTGAGPSTIRAWCVSPDGWLCTFASQRGQRYYLTAEGVQKILLEAHPKSRAAIETHAKLVLQQLAPPSTASVTSSSAADPDASPQMDDQTDTAAHPAGSAAMNSLEREVQRLQSRLDGLTARNRQLEDEVARWKRIAHRNDDAMMRQRENWREFDAVNSRSAERSDG